TSQQTSPLTAEMVYAHLKVSPQNGEKILPFLERALTVDTASSAVKDYYLSALLLDRRLEEFVDTLSAFYNVDDKASLPTHYKEALWIYGKISGDSTMQLKDTAMARKYSELLALEREHKDILVRSNYVRRFFGQTYGWYYLYEDN
ncbi:MAG: hypothetical protein IJY75_03615, partial [Bacteroidaceae bacterium]|nr:hypothetical protein [Bacteroidaceae bacterium]